jgi:hypothetical protein
MAKLALKTLLLFALVTLISVVLTSRLLPVFWAHPDAEAKLEYWKERKQDYNTLFIGSSRIFHHVVPSRFDSLANAAGYKISSFNLGVAAFPMPQSFTMTSQVLEEAPGLKHVFIEVTPVYFTVARELINTPKNYYWYDYRHMMLLCRHINAEKMGAKKKRELCREHVLSWVEKNMFVGGAQTVFTSMVTGEEAWVKKQCATDAGFISFEAEKKSGPYKTETIVRRKEFLKDTTILEKRRAIARQGAFGRKTIRTPYADYIGELYKDFTARGVKVYFVITPRLGTYAGLQEMLAKVPQESIIDLSSPDQFPGFYSFENSFDRGHMNTMGAKLFTDKLFELSLGRFVP